MYFSYEEDTLWVNKISSAKLMHAHIPDSSVLQLMTLEEGIWTLDGGYRESLMSIYIHHDNVVEITNRNLPCLCPCRYSNPQTNRKAVN